MAATAKAPYSIDENLWGLAIEAGALEDPWAAPPEDCWQITTDPGQASDRAGSVVIGFTRGTPTSLDGEPLCGTDLIVQLGALAGAHGIGRIDVIEDRLVGIKSREVYEAPAAIALHIAREALEQLTLDRETRRVKAELGQQFARLVYDGLWFTPLRRSIQAFVEEAVRPVTGEVRLALFKGVATAVGRHAPAALYDRSLATYGEGDIFRHTAAAGFIEIFSLAAKTTNAAERRAVEGASKGHARGPLPPLEQATFVPKGRTTKPRGGPGTRPHMATDNPVHADRASLARNSRATAVRTARAADPRTDPSATARPDPAAPPWIDSVATPRAGPDTQPRTARATTAQASREAAFRAAAATFPKSRPMGATPPFLRHGPDSQARSGPVPARTDRPAALAVAETASRPALGESEEAGEGEQP